MKRTLRRRSRGLGVMTLIGICLLPSCKGDLFPFQTARSSDSNNENGNTEVESTDSDTTDGRPTVVESTDSDSTDSSATDSDSTDSDSIDSDSTDSESTGDETTDVDTGSENDSVTTDSAGDTETDSDTGRPRCECVPRKVCADHRAYIVEDEPCKNSEDACCFAPCEDPDGSFCVGPGSMECYNRGWFLQEKDLRHCDGPDQVCCSPIFTHCTFTGSCFKPDGAYGQQCLASGGAAGRGCDHEEDICCVGDSEY